MRRFFLPLVFLFVLVAPGQAQIQWGANHPELEWLIFETPHFKIIYHKELTAVAREAGQIAEASFFSISRALHTKPDRKIVLVLQDTDDYSNGESNPLGHVIRIWTPDMPKYTTGRLQWLRRVLSHELTHELHFWKLRNVTGVWWELLGLGTTPDWFTEGLAQYEGETWDLHRDLLLRIAWWSQRLLRVKDLQGFVGTDPIDSRLVYEEGHSLVRYGARRWGDDFLPNLIQQHRRFPLSFDWNLHRKTALSERRLYRVWLDSLSQHYLRWKKGREFMSEVARPFAAPFRVALSIRWAPDGKKAAAVGISRMDSWLPKLYVFDKTQAVWRRVGGLDVHAQTSWSPNGQQVAYSRGRPGISLSTINDLFVYDLTKRKEFPLTQNERATDPDFSPDGRSLIFVKHFPGRSNLMILDLRSRRIRQITDFPLQTEVFSPRWSPDGTQIAFSLVDSSGHRMVAAIRPDGSALHILQDSGYDCRSPEWSPDGTHLTYIDYRFGTPNLFVMNADGSEPQAVTNAFGGLFNPNWSPDGKRIFAVVFEKRDSVQIVSLPADRRVSPHWGPLSVPWTWENRTFQRFPPPQKPVPMSPPVAYLSRKNLQSLIWVPVVQQDDRGYEGGFFHYLADPLSEHALQSQVTVGDRRLSADFVYTNTQYLPTFSIGVGQNYDRCRGFLNRSDFGEQHRTAFLQVDLPFALGRNVYARHRLSAEFSVQKTRVFLNRTVTFPKHLHPFSGYRNALSLAYTYRYQLPDVGNSIHPTTGVRFSAAASWADPLFGSTLRYTEGLTQLVGHLSLPFRRDVLALRAGGFFHFGDWLPQSPPKLSSQLIRALPSAPEGTRQIYGTAEYRVQLVRNLRFYFLRLLYVERLTAAFFVDGGRVWGESTTALLHGRALSFGASSWRTTAGTELRVRLWPLAKVGVVVRVGVGREVEPTKSWKGYILFAPVF